MLNREIFANSIRENWFLWVAASVVNVLLVLILLLTSSTGQISMAAGVSYGDLSPAEWIITRTVFFPILGTMVPLIYIVSASNRLIVGEVEKGTMVYTLSSKISRKTVHLSKMYYLILFIVFLEIILLICGLIMLTFINTSAWYVFIDLEAEVPTEEIIHLNRYSLADWSFDVFGSTLLMLASASIAFFFSSLLNKVSESYVAGGGILIAFLIFSILSSLSDQGNFLYNFRYVTMNTFFNAVENTPSNPKGWVWQYLILAGIATGLFVGSNFVFIKKDLLI